VCALSRKPINKGVDDMRWFWLVIGCLILYFSFVGPVIARSKEDGPSPGVLVFVHLIVVLVMGWFLVTRPWELAHLAEEIVHTLFQGTQALFQFIKAVALWLRDLVPND
jgi:hypothetical protein